MSVEQVELSVGVDGMTAIVCSAESCFALGEVPAPMRLILSLSTRLHPTNWLNRTDVSSFDIGETGGSLHRFSQ